MLDQPVPNPLAKNPNVYTHKVFAAVGLILIGTIIAVAGVWWYVENQTGAETANKTTTTKVSTSSAKKTTASAEKEETADWKIYTSTKFNYSLKYPTEWLTTDCDPSPVLFAPKKNYLGVCNSGFGGLISVSNNPAPGFDEVTDNYVAANYDDFKKETLSVGVKTAVRISGTSKINNEIVDERGTKIIVYLIELGPSFLSINYSQSKSWDDYSQEFEQMVSTFKFL